MRISQITRVPAVATVLAATVLAATVLAPRPTAWALPQTCPTPRADAVSLTVVSPVAGAKVGGRVEVEGRFSGSDPIFQVELFVGDSRKDAVDIQPPASSGSFALVWDTAGATGGATTLVVVACGGEPAAGALVRGSTAVPVTVTADPAAPRSSRLVPAKTEADGPGSRPWVLLAIGGPGLLGLGYALGVRPPRRRSPTTRSTVKPPVALPSELPPAPPA